MTEIFARRTFLSAAAATVAAATLASCSSPPPVGQRILSTDSLVAKRETRRPWNGNSIAAQLVAAQFATSVAGKSISTWGYNGGLVAPTLRATAGDKLNVSLTNSLTEATSIHWHGVALQNAADGVPGLTQQAIKPGAEYAYQFRVDTPGTYWYHSHVEMQRARGLYGALIIDDPKEPLHYDKEWVVVLDDWVDGFGQTPDSILTALSAGMGMSGMSGKTMDSSSPVLMNSKSVYLGGDAGDVKIPVHLMNGRASSNPETFAAKPGDRIRLRIINAAGDTAYRVGIPGQQLLLTHTDGFPTKPENVDAVVLGMGERIDALVTVKEGTSMLLSLPEGKDGNAVGFISTSVGSTPPVSALPTQLTGIVTDGGRLKADPSVLLAEAKVDRTHHLNLTGSMMKYKWGINGRSFDMTNPYAGAFEVRTGERVRVVVTNTTTMWHPLHLHGHSFQLANGGARKDTVIVRPKQQVTFEFDADNPGQWLTHCHNAYHAARGMMGVFSYIS
jgi:FtsP/CotA-like multicopper oxidase with cupredoxin domain